MSLELVLLVPVLVLLAVFVLWAGRGGRAGLTADLAAEEAATAAAVCCDEGEGEGPEGDRERVVEEMLRSRPGLDFLCIGGPRGTAEGGSGEFVDESWVEFEPGRASGGVGVLGVRFVCETDGAVAPLRGLFPTVTFAGQASEIVLRQPMPIETAAPNSIWIEPPSEPVDEGEELVFTVRTDEGVLQNTRVQWLVYSGSETTAGDFVPSVAMAGTVMIPAGGVSKDIRFKTVADDLHEGPEDLVLDLVPGTEEEFDGTAWVPSSRAVNIERLRAVGTIEDVDLRPYLWVEPAAARVGEGDPVTFQVRLRDASGTRSAPSARQVTVDAVTKGNGVAAGATAYGRVDCDADGVSGVADDADYVTERASLTFDPREVEKLVTVQACDDDDAPQGEPDEWFTLVLENENGAPVARGEAVVTIDDDEVKFASIMPAWVLEGQEPSGSYTFTAALDAKPVADVRLEYNVRQNAADSMHNAKAGTSCGPDVDFVAPLTGQLLFMAGRDRATFEVEVCDDSEVERAETFWIGITRAASRGGEVVVPANSGQRITIRNDDGVVISAKDQSGTEAPAGGSLTFSVNLTEDGEPALLSEAVSVRYALEQDSPMSAEQCVDYQVAAVAGVPAGDCGNPDPAVSGLEGTLDFGPGTAAALTIEVELLADDEREDPETFRLRLFDGDGGDIAPLAEVVAVGTIVDDAPPVLTVSDFEGREGTTQRFTVELAGTRPGGDVTVDYEVAGHGSPPNAATAPPGSPPGNPRDFQLLAEGPGDARAPDGLTGTLTLNAARRTADVRVSLLSDSLDEPVEQLSLTLSDPVGAVLFDRYPSNDADGDGDPDNDPGEAYGVGTVFDVDGPELCVLDTSAPEGTTMTFTVAVINPRLVGGAYESVTADYTVEARSADEGIDFVQPGAGTLTFDASDSTALTPGMRAACDPPADVAGTVLAETVTVGILTDRIAESPETLHLVLGGRSPGHVGLAKAVGVGTIVNVNAAVVRVNNSEAPEGDSDQPLEFVISLVDDDRNAVDRIDADVTVRWWTEDRTAEAGVDYTAVSGSYNFTVNGVANGVTTRTVEVATLADTMNEDDETMALLIALDSDDNPDNDAAVLGDSEGVGTIIDAPLPRLSIDDVKGEEGEVLEFSVTLDRASDETVTVYAHSEDRAARAPGDYEALARTELTFDPGVTSRPVRIQTHGNDDDEQAGNDDDEQAGSESVLAEEDFVVVLSEPSNAEIARALGRGTISEPCIDINDADQDPPGLWFDTGGRHGSPYPYGVGIEGGSDNPLDPSGTERVLVRVLLDRPLCQSAGLEIWFEAGTATRSDATWSPQGPLLPAGQLFIGTGFLTIEDALDEDDETLTVQARWARSGFWPLPSHYHLPAITMTATILDDDPPPSVRIAEASAREGEPLPFEVTLNTPSGRTVALEYRTVAVTATAGSDYADTYESATDWTSVTIPPGGTSHTITVPTVADTRDEGDETLRVELRAPAGANALIDDAAAVGTILEGDRPRLSIADARGDEGAALQFQVTLSEPAAAPLTVSYVTADQAPGPRRATAGADYVAAAEGSSVTIGAGWDTAVIEVQARTDDVEEADETFLVNVTGAAGVSLADASAVGTINGAVACLDPESGQGPPTVTIDDASASESDSAIAFTVRLSEPLCVPGFMRFATSSGSAWSGVDFESDDRIYAIEPLAAERVLSVVLIDDDLHEDTETFRVSFRWYTTMPSAYTETGTVWGDGTIVDDDDEPAVSVASVSAVEGEPLGFTVRLDGPSGRDTTVDYATADLAAGDGAATAGDDYRGVSGTATIPAGELSAPVVVVNTVEDGLDEATERFELRLSSPDGAVLADGARKALGSILDDDDPPVVRIFDTSENEDDPLVFALRLDGPSGRTTSVDWATADGTAVAPGDYTAASGTVTFAAGDTYKTVTVQSKGDEVAEGDEEFFVNLSNRPLLVGGDDLAAGTIRDVTQRRLSVSDAFAREGRALGFRVGFDGPASSRDVTVRYRTVAGTARAVDDYSDRFESAGTARGLVRILAGRSFAVVWVATVDDRLDEDAERLRLVLSDPVGAVFADGGGEAVGVIIDDDPLPALSVDDPEATENDKGVPITFTVSLSELSGRDVEVRYDTADGVAEAVEDYVAVADGSATISAGGRSAVVSVALVDDDDPEDLERFQLVLSEPVNATIDDGAGVGTIIDDDGLVQILVDGPAAVREADGAAAVFGVRLSRAADAEVTVAYATADGTAEAPGDYTTASDTLTFAVGETSKEVSVAVVDDDDVEDTETFELVLSGPSANAAVGDDHERTVAAIIDDDGEPELSVADASAVEGGAAVFVVTADKAPAEAVSFAYAAVTDPTAGAAAAVPGLDFDAVTGTGIIVAQATSTTVRVPVRDDALDEHNETFWLRITIPPAPDDDPPPGFSVVDGTATGAITDNDPLPQITIADSRAEEGDPVRFTVRLTPASGRTVTVPWAAAARSAGDDRAAAGADFTAASNTVAFAAGATAAIIDVATIEDELPEPDETFHLNLGEPTNATVDDATAVGAILDDDGLPRASIAGTEVPEDDSPATFTVTLSRASTRTVTLQYYTTDGTARAGADYATAAGARGDLVIPAGLDTGEISVYIADDDLVEGAETFTITLHNPDNAVIAQGAGTATGTILDDDITRLAITGAQATEGDGTIDFTVTADPAPPTGITVRYSTFDGTATQPGDYTATTRTLTIHAGDTRATATVALTDDIYHEDPEAFLVRLNNPSTGAEIDKDNDTATGIILDDDDLPVIEVDAVAGGEDSGTLTYRVTLSHASDKEVRVDYSTMVYFRCGVVARGQPPADRDGPQPFKHISGRLVFEPGAITHNVDLPLVDNDHKCRFAHSAFWRVDLILADPVNATIGRDLAPRAFIWDDENVPALGFAPRDAEAVESAGSVSFTISMRRINDTDVTIPYTAGEISTLAGRDSIFSNRGDQFYGRVEATAADDFTAVTGTATIPAGQRSTTISVPVVDDTVSEPTEHFGVLLTRRNSQYIIGDHTARGTIIDNDGASLSVSDVEISEGAGSASFRVALDRPSSRRVTVGYATADGTATQPGDYTAARGTLTFEPGATEAFAEVALVDDTDEESDESFTLTLANPSGAAVSHGSATATIIDDDGDQDLPVLWITDARSPEEGRLNEDGVEFGYRLSKTPTKPITVRYQTIETPWLGDRAATANVDYIAVSRTGYLWGGPGGRGGVEGSFQVLYRQDSTPEHDEMFMLLLSDPVNVVLGNDRAWGTILNNDVPTVSVQNVTASEGDASVEFTVQLHAPGVLDASVRYRTVVQGSAGDAAATPDEDYADTTGTLHIAAGTESATITVPITDDGTDEPDETFILELYEPKLLTLEKASAIGTITDDDPGYWIDADRSVWENAGTMEFTVRRDHTSDEAVDVDYTVTGVSATAGASCGAGVDFIAPSGTLTLAPAAMSGTIAVTVCNDTVAESRETLLIELTGVPGRDLSATGAILDGD